MVIPEEAVLVQIFVEIVTTLAPIEEKTPAAQTVAAANIPMHPGVIT